MIPVIGYRGHKVAVLGLGRSGLASAAALLAGGAEPLLWDESAQAREKAEAAGYALTDLSRAAAFDGVAALITSPGIPHLYPSPHPIIARAMELGIPVDNDIGLFFRSYATPEWDNFEIAPRVICVTGSNGKSTTTALPLSVSMLSWDCRASSWSAICWRLRPSAPRSSIWATA
jgi:UDP-N-acetylmuramoylalanine--D-glutamate ligase